MKYLSILLLSLFLFSCNLGKTVVFQTDKFSFREKIDDQWTEFSTWQPTHRRKSIKKYSKNTL
jgi:hypothetical protein